MVIGFNFTQILLIVAYSLNSFTLTWNSSQFEYLAALFPKLHFPLQLYFHNPGLLRLLLRLCMLYLKTQMASLKLLLKSFGESFLSWQQSRNFNESILLFKLSWRAPALAEYARILKSFKMLLMD